MRDIVATIQAEQDVVIRAPLDLLLVVQGGPGTGKTAVGLHRAALLLYDHREVLERDGVLVVGPNRLFLRYIAQVLPSLGETSVVQTTLAGLGAVDVGGEDTDAVAALKGDARMAELIERAAWGRTAPLAEPLTAHDPLRPRAPRRRGGQRPARRVPRRAPCAGRRSSVGSARERFRIEVVKRARRALRRPPPRGAADRRRPATPRCAASAELRRALDRVWPATTAPALVRRLLTSATLPGPPPTAS